ncbi:nicotinamide riboside transporter PnuC [Xylanibacter brevis]|uniref:nicotinamide riboside transporter PnuC n=1 Tax=Xylanibacter brevis TaxID=83231 RepID=UPI000A7E60DF
MMIVDYIQTHQLECFSMALGLVYLWCEYRASILLWFVGIVMPLVDIVLYWQNGLYADSVMDGYYAVAAIWGFCMWQWGKKEGTKVSGGKEKHLEIGHFPIAKLLPVTAAFLAVWAMVWLWLTYGTPSNVPISDSFVNALSIIGLWALSRKYIEQWFIWVVVDAIKVALYAYKGIPVKGSYYAISVVIAVLGYLKWRRMMQKRAANPTTC